MKMDLSIYEMSLRQTERDLGALADERARIKREIKSRQTELRDLAQKRIEWLQLSGHLKKTLGLELTEEETKLCPTVPVASERLVTITPETFKGMSIAEAGRKYLLMLGRGVTTRELIDNLPKGGVVTEAQHLDAAFRNAMSRRPDWFVLIREKGRLGRWELAEWQNGDVDLSEDEVLSSARRAPAVPESAVSASPAA